MKRVEHILETCLCVDDLHAARRFYTEVLGLEVAAEQNERHLFFRVGNRMLLLFDPKESSKPLGTIPPHGTHGASHVCFGVREAELAIWHEQLLSAGVVIESVHDWPQGGRSIYFRDPAGNSLEFATPRIWGIREDTLARD
ncbi:Virulence protein [Anatilimnocola aggregata]|uniref:Virulence protein n=1 Tax=Anatilimnocola aggregata TaxID=2528021 RepID=A0A517YD97_9BACT|nr:VOC family protein [Anatilimnocola aggregata]QDU28208.1 Virulence protein [Anatilimnocola aggregata]